MINFIKSEKVKDIHDSPTFSCQKSHKKNVGATLCSANSKTSWRILLQAQVATFRTSHLGSLQWPSDCMFQSDGPYPCPWFKQKRLNTSKHPSEALPPRIGKITEAKHNFLAGRKWLQNFKNQVLYLRKGGNWIIPLSPPQILSSPRLRW